jgi:hypothetical protein
MNLRAVLLSAQSKTQETEVGGKIVLFNAGP